MTPKPKHITFINYFFLESGDKILSLFGEDQRRCGLQGNDFTQTCVA